MVLVGHIACMGEKVNVEPSTTRLNPITNLYLKEMGRRFTVIGSIAVFASSQRSS
jgi:hypothetical protein